MYASHKHKNPHDSKNTQLFYFLGLNCINLQQVEPISEEVSGMKIHRIQLIFYITSNVLDFIFIWAEFYCDTSEQNAGILKPVFMFLCIEFGFLIIHTKLPGLWCNLAILASTDKAAVLDIQLRNTE